MLALNGLRVSEAIGANIEALGVERGHRTRTVLRKGGKTVTIPLAPRTARAVDLAVGERCAGPIFTTAHGGCLDRHGAARIVRRVARRAGITKPIGPHTLPHAFITAALDTDVPLRDVQEAASHADPRTTMRHDRARVSLDRHATYIAGGGRQVSRPGAHRRQPPSTLNAEYALGAGSSSNPVGWRRSSSSVVRSPPRELLGGHPGRWPSPALCGPASRSLPGDRRPT